MRRHSIIVHIHNIVKMSSTESDMHCHVVLPWKSIFMLFKHVFFIFLLIKIRTFYKKIDSRENHSQNETSTVSVRCVNHVYNSILHSFIHLQHHTINVWHTKTLHELKLMIHFEHAMRILSMYEAKINCNWIAIVI